MIRHKARYANQILRAGAVAPAGRRAKGAADWSQLRVFAPLRANDVVTGNLKSSIQQKTFANRKIRHG
ncbi:hypothetical protein AN476_04740 [Phaeobacter sp. 11ANDIMAR09]|nr:hypothetical protein AN476_04740 [Phaeobacter sp. 11ANDIMAR09]